MNSRWESFLQDAGAVIEEGRVVHFGNPERERQVATAGSIIADLSHRGLISAYGPDALTFLQGQLTNDVSRIDPGHSHLGGYCSPKGRLLSVYRLFRRDDVYYLCLPGETLDATLERLKKFVLMSKVTLEDAGDSLVRFGLAGPHADDEASQVLGEIPTVPNDVLQTRDLTVMRVPGIHPRFEIAGPPEAARKVWSELDVRAAPVGAGIWTLLDILAGVPSVYPETADEFIPQTVNLDLLNGISFDKGCYTGQEIVARLHYRGSVKRRMYLARCDTETPPAPGTAVVVAGDEGRTAGNVVVAAPAPDAGCALLASLITDQADEALRLGDGAGPPLTLGALPYGLPDA